LFRPSFVPTMPVGIGAFPSVVRMPFSFSLLPNSSLNGTAGERGSFSLAFGRLPVSSGVMPHPICPLRLHSLATSSGTLTVEVTPSLHKTVSGSSYLFNSRTHIKTCRPSVAG
jgi:hypothetical protein